MRKPFLSNVQHPLADSLVRLSVGIEDLAGLRAGSLHEWRQAKIIASGRGR